MAITIAPTSCEIDSRLDNLADALDLSLVEEDSAAPASPVAQAWRTLDQGDLIQVRLGLDGEAMDDYGVFRVDECALEANESSWRTRVHGRDQAAMLIEERAQESYGFGTWPDDDPETFTYPSARSVAQAIAARVGLGFIWDAPNFTQTSFTLQPEESASQALGRLLEPLRVSRRYPADVWVEGESLVVRRRGNGPNAGAIDCSLGQVRSIRRARQPVVGEVTVYGATYVALTVYQREEKQSQAGAGESGEGEPQASVRIVEDSPTHRVVETGIVQADETFVVITRETEDLTYQDVADADGNWVGRVLLASEVLEEADLHKPTPRRSRKKTAFGYDDEWRLVLRDERTEEYRSDGSLKKAGHVVTRFEQVTPTDTRMVTTELKVAADGTETVKKGFPKWEQAPGVLQSSVRQAPDPEGKWEEQPDRSAPPNAKKTEYTSQYQGSADGGGTMPRVYRHDSLVGTDICQQIADDLAAESGKWLYQVGLFWPRPFSYRKGQKVTLTGLPGGCTDLADAIITSVHTRYDEGEAVWSHDVEFECWRDE
jgi:phage protein D